MTIDEKLRGLQRAAALGDLDARYKLQLMEERLGFKKPMLTVLPHHCMRAYPQRACYATTPTEYNECYCDCQGCIASREARAREDGSLSETSGFHCYNRASKKHGYCSIMQGKARCTCDCAACSRARFLSGKRNRQNPRPDKVIKCEICGVNKKVGRANVCEACYKKQLAYQPGRKCRICSIDSGGEKPFYGSSDICVACHSSQSSYQSGRKCRICSIDSGGEKPFSGSADICVACYASQLAYQAGRKCKICGINSGGGKPFSGGTDICGACEAFRRAYRLGKKCRICGADSGGEKPFQGDDMCSACYIKYLANKPGRKCRICNIASGRGKPFYGSSDICIACAAEQRTYKSGDRCEDCGIESGGERGFSKKGLCGSCAIRRYSWKKRNWPVLCVSNIHTLPPPRNFIYGQRGRRRDFPQCSCYIDDQGNIIPDPEIRLIPLEDEPDPSRNYIPLKDRLAQMEERYDAGESSEKSNIPGHGARLAKFYPEGRKGFSGKSPRRSTRGGTQSDIGPRRPSSLRHLRRFNPAWQTGQNLRNPIGECDICGKLSLRSRP